ncbi:MAG: patatin-like phospholipase family protein [Clostridiales bacterium]|nr:patatin-like phospholipase family protein [Clostridiales bacterium]
MAFLLCASGMKGVDASPMADGHQSVGLVLSGGGAKGIAHIGVLQALEDNDIPIDYVAGTSMGAIVGGLYAAGYTPAEMMELILSRGFAYWSTGRIDENLVYYFAKNEPTPSMINVPLSLGSKSDNVTRYPTSLISPLPMNFAFMDLFAAYTAQCGGDFDRLFVPYRCVASDVKNKHKVVMKGGQLGDAIRSSMSFPVVFQPIEMDSVLLYDGGIYDNFPVDVMRSEFAPTIMIGVDVHGTTDPAKARDLLNQIEEMVIQNNDYELPPDEGIKLRIDLNEFSLLDFPAARAIYRKGYDKAMEMMDSIKIRITSREPQNVRELRRAVFKSSTPFLEFDKVNVTGGSQEENRYIKYLFTGNRTDTFGIEKARLAYYRAVTPGKLSDLHPTAIYNDTTGLFTLNLQADVKNNITIGIGGYLTSSTNSMAFLSAGYKSMSLKTMDASLSAWIGQSYMAGALTTRYVLPAGTPTSLSVQIVGSRRKYYESDRMFFDSSAPSFITREEAFGRIGVSMALGRWARMTIDGGGGTIANRFYNNDAWKQDREVSRDMTRFNIAQGRILFDGSTLDDLTAPTSGRYFKISGSWNVGTYRFKPGDAIAATHKRHGNWVQAQVQWKGYQRVNDHFSLGGELDAVYTNHKLLDNYNASIVNAPGFNPTPAADNTFNPAFRANSFIAIGAVPVWIINDNLQLRGNFHLFQPVRRIQLDRENGTPYYGKAFARRFAYCEIAGAYTFRFATLSVWGNYQSYPARNWNVGVSFGLYFLAPQL